MGSRHVAASLLILVLAGCGTDATLSTVTPETSTALSVDGCMDPPPEALAAERDFALIVVPDTTVAGDDLHVMIDYDKPPGRAVRGVTAMWQCWNGEKWINTHQLLQRGPDGSPAAVEIQPGEYTTTPAVGVLISQAPSYRMVAPDVSPGIYRIKDSIHLGGGTVLTGYGKVEVIDSPEDTEALSFEGLWLLDSFEVDGVRHQVDVGLNAARHPWIEIDRVLDGSTGCNRFGGDYTFSDGVLFPGEVIMTAAACVESDGADLMATERVFTDALWVGENAITVVVDGDTMTWIMGDTTLVFVAADEIPQPPPPPTVHAFGRLDCSPGHVVEERHEGHSFDPEQLLIEAAPEVVLIEAGQPLWWWGYNAAGEVIAGVAEGDIVPPQYQVFTCTE